MYVWICTYVYTVGDDYTAVYLEDVPIGTIPYGEGEMCTAFISLLNLLMCVRIHTQCSPQKLFQAC